MNKLFCYIMAISILSLTAIRPALSQVKFDITATSGKATETVSEWGGKAKKVMDENATLQTLISYGKAAKEGIANLQALKEMAEQTVGDVVDSANQIKDEATGMAGDISGEIGGISGAVGGAVGGVAGGAAAKAQSAQELLKAQNEKKELEAKSKEEITTQQAEVSGKVKALEDNNANLQKMITENPAKKTEYDAMIVANDKQIADYNASLKQISDTVGAQYSSQLADLDTKIATAKAKAQEDALAGLSAGADKLKGMLGDTATAEELNKTIAKNFVGANEPVNEENRKRVDVNRRATQVVDTVGALNAALNIKKGLDENNDKTDETKGKADTSEGASSSVTMDIQLKIQNMKALVKYTKLLVADMKMRTANDMAGLSRYKLRDSEKDITQFNLDDYKYKSSECGKEKKKKGLDGLKDTAKSVKGKVSAAKGVLNDAMDIYNAGTAAYNEVSPSFKSGGGSSNNSNNTGNSGGSSNYNQPYDGEEEIIEEEVIEYDESLPLEEEEESNFVADKTEGEYEEEARTRAGQNPIDEDAMTQDEYERAAREAGSAGVSGDFKATAKSGVGAEAKSGVQNEVQAAPMAAMKAAPKSALTNATKSSSRTSFKSATGVAKSTTAKSSAVAIQAGEKK